MAAVGDYDLAFALSSPARRAVHGEKSGTSGRTAICSAAAKRAVHGRRGHDVGGGMTATFGIPRPSSGTGGVGTMPLMAAYKTGSVPITRAVSPPPADVQCGVSGPREVGCSQSPTTEDITMTRLHAAASFTLALALQIGAASTPARAQAPAFKSTSAKTAVAPAAKRRYGTPVKLGDGDARSYATSTKSSIVCRCCLATLTPGPSEIRARLSVTPTSPPTSHPTSHPIVFSARV